jgi:hypothetical protein
MSKGFKVKKFRKINEGIGFNNIEDNKNGITASNVIGLDDYKNPIIAGIKSYFELPNQYGQDALIYDSFERDCVGGGYQFVVTDDNSATADYINVLRRDSAASNFTVLTSLEVNEDSDVVIWILGNYLYIAADFADGDEVKYSTNWGSSWSTLTWPNASISKPLWNQRARSGIPKEFKKNYYYFDQAELVKIDKEATEISIEKDFSEYYHIVSSFEFLNGFLYFLATPANSGTSYYKEPRLSLVRYSFDTGDFEEIDSFEHYADRYGEIMKFNSKLYYPKFNRLENEIVEFDGTGFRTKKILSGTDTASLFFQWFGIFGNKLFYAILDETDLDGSNDTYYLNFLTDQFDAFENFISLNLTDFLIPYRFTNFAGHITLFYPSNASDPARVIRVRNDSLQTFGEYRLPNIDKDIIPYQIDVKHDPLVAGQEVEVYYSTDASTDTFLGESTTTGATKKSLKFPSGIEADYLDFLIRLKPDTTDVYSPRNVRIELIYKDSPLKNG